MLKRHHCSETSHSENPSMSGLTVREIKRIEQIQKELEALRRQLAELLGEVE